MSRTKNPPAVLAPVARTSIVDNVAERLEAEILSGRYEAGSRLPAERDLATALGVNRLTLRAALARLEALGFIATRHGAGTVVQAWRERVGLDVLPIIMRSLTPQDQPWKELMLALLEVRRLMVAEAIGLAAERHTKANLDELRRLAKAQEARVDDVLAFARGDIEFQRAVVRAAGNVGFELILNTFAKFPESLPEMVAKLYDDRAQAIELYGAVIDVISSGDPQGARDGVRHMLASVDEVWSEKYGLAAKIEKGKKKSAKK
jgi:GntR family transcriptional regulator, transcriptional repressor for pyruvate dehydrogenase complex